LKSTHRFFKSEATIGGEYRLQNIGLRQWQKLATEVHLDPQEVIRQVAAMADAIPAHVSEVAGRLKKGGLTHPILTRIEKKLAALAAHCASFLPPAALRRFHRSSCFD